MLYKATLLQGCIFISEDQTFFVIYVRQLLIAEKLLSVVLTEGVTAQRCGSTKWTVYILCTFPTYFNPIIETKWSRAGQLMVSRGISGIPTIFRKESYDFAKKINSAKKSFVNKNCMIVRA